jgi:glycosyltransferase involved in cell wall biosynthesis
LRILSYTTLFPNPQQPTHGVFVRERILALAKLAEVRVVAPVPWFPRTRLLGDRYYRYSLVPRNEIDERIAVGHPRYPVIPRLCKTADGALLAAGSFHHMQKLRRQFPFDIIDAHWGYPDGAAAALLATRLHVPFSVTVRGDDVNVFLRQFWRRPWIRWSLQRANLVIALSRELKEILVANGVTPAKISVIPNGIDPKSFHPVDRKLARARLGLPLDGRIILSVGRLHESKGFPIMVEAIGRLTGRFPDLQIHIVGAPDHEADATQEIMRAAEHHRIRDRLHFAGPQQPAMMKYWYGAADLFCLPTSREGSANVLLEAMACGLPCITTPVGGNRDAINSNEVGFLAAPGVEEMSGALAAGLTNNWNITRIAEHGLSRTWGTVAAECRDHLSATLCNTASLGTG